MCYVAMTHWLVKLYICGGKLNLHLLDSSLDGKKLCLPSLKSLHLGLPSLESSLCGFLGLSSMKSSVCGLLGLSSMESSVCLDKILSCLIVHQTSNIFVG